MSSPTWPDLPLDPFPDLSVLDLDAPDDADDPPARVVGSARLRLLPWRPRWRSGGRDGLELPDLPDLDDPISAVLGLLLLVLLLPVVVAVVFGVAVLSLEMLALLPLGLLLLVGRLVRLRPWVLTVTYRDGARDEVEVFGLRATWRRRRELLAG